MGVLIKAPQFRLRRRGQPICHIDGYFAMEKKMVTHSAWISFTGGVLLALHGVQHASDTPVLDMLYVVVLTGAVCGFIVMPLEASVMKRWVACCVACMSVAIPFIFREVMR